MKLLILFAALLAVGCDDDPTAAPNDPGDSAWTTWTQANGLPHGAVTGIEVAPDGSLWFNHAIEGGGGVTHFDGTIFTHYDESNGLPTNLVLWYHAIAVQPNGDVWVGTHENGVMHFDGENWGTHTKADGLGGDTVVAVTVAPNGDVWCIGDGISRRRDDTWADWSLQTLGLAPFAFSVGVCSDGEVWVGGMRMACYDGEAWTFRAHLLPTGPATAVAVAPDGSVWVGGDGMTRFDGENRQHHSRQEMGLGQFGDFGIGSIAIDDDGLVWAATSGQGVVRFDGDDWTRFTSADGLLDDGAFSVAIGHDGAVWVGSNLGLSRYMRTDQD
jgi:streptogramin lyase